MASVFAHGLSAFAFGKLFPKQAMSTKVIVLGMLSAIMPDFDIISFSFGIPYEHMLGHRGITHSLAFALIWSIILVLFFHKRSSRQTQKILFIFYALCCASHGLLDALTTGGEGVAFFAPFTGTRYFLPWSIIKVSPIGAERFFSEWGLQVLYSEFKWVGIPSLLMIILGSRWRAN